MSEQSLTLRDPEDLPALYRATNSMALDGQNRAIFAIRLRLGALLVATLGGLIAWSLSGVAVGGLVSLFAFLVAIGAELYSATERPEEQWYEGRAAAESVKTLAWRYAVGGELATSGSVDVDTEFLKEIRDVLHDLKSVEVDPSVSENVQISDAMRTARKSHFEDRKNLYLVGRINDQSAWYASKAAWNAKRAKQWVIASIFFEISGVVAAAMQAFGGLNIDLLGLFAAIAAIITAWVQVKQHRNLATAYGVTAQELALVASETEALTDEALWPRFVGEAEEAISREHTLWRASRGIRIRW